MVSARPLPEDRLLGLRLELGVLLGEEDDVLERLLQRYQNVKSELEAQQNLERIRAERMASSGQWNWGSTTTKAGAQVA